VLYACRNNQEYHGPQVSHHFHLKQQIAVQTGAEQKKPQYKVNLLHKPEKTGQNEAKLDCDITNCLPSPTIFTEPSCIDIYHL